ncbi:hypothetical protein BU26DRAFT_289094 [Trematosphaeria pertusa]|uniref:Uncharacterized protein n=1 Tax=Trematosphaeria pertusa TaxID=390896 RepID=A0A6A6IH48_9PLEO|nr:uncharacterized protein BU26DRAFT_289094 [Trematosphaeria pertusa]KAF2249751.1 hypothetical protein BU26DRAFT_289094 [Trematosphaeria pertusa]
MHLMPDKAANAIMSHPLIHSPTILPPFSPSSLIKHEVIPHGLQKELGGRIVQVKKRRIEKPHKSHILPKYDEKSFMHGTTATAIGLIGVGYRSLPHSFSSCLFLLLSREKAKRILLFRLQNRSAARHCRCRSRRVVSGKPFRFRRSRHRDCFDNSPDSLYLLE